jgi:hypothetical protein
MVQKKIEAVAARATAGLRGASWNASRLPPDLVVSVHALPTSDGAQITGFLYRRGNERTVAGRQSMHGNHEIGRQPARIPRSPAQTRGCTGCDSLYFFLRHSNLPKN